MSKPRSVKSKPSEMCLVELKGNVTPNTKAKIIEMHQKTGWPMAWLVQFALDNERDCVNPFQYDCKIPENPPFKENQYIHEAHKILNFMFQHFTKGTGLEQWCLLRRDMGIESKEIFLLAFRELIHAGLVEEIPAPISKVYPKDYTFWKLANILIEKQKIERLQKIRKYRPTKKGVLDEIK